ncbi:family 4 carbohydrate esterase [Melampsora larici-populina 98AG31]|uniref:Family 4 carbohydrate esterase n=1 Tax=Melampsora larici-populina (strain 98AG31 / pathotype 3-4-7) TaxID=747676 RepID=F4RX94_MELLP|nr:family 4 carbohydrate esterase [Melampsora larici-populina 98AG31]EGG03026.1 family 4 carbohydrate esterase [Melampsora larici-populina 98AG31]
MLFFSNSLTIKLVKRQTDLSDQLSQDLSQLDPTSSTIPNPPSSSVSNTLTTNTKVPIYDICSMPQSFALTFDDGPSEFSAGLDTLLNSNGAKASFFVNGNNVGCIYDYAPVLIARFNAGHLIGSHTWSHIHLNSATYEEINQQLDLLEQALIKILGVKPRWFRPPYGEYNDLVLQVLAERGYKGLVLWTHATGDANSNPPSPDSIVQFYQSYGEKSNILNHEITSSTPQTVIPAVLPQLGEKFKLVTAPSCLNLSNDPKDWYQFVGTPSTKDASWTCSGTPSG